MTRFVILMGGDLTVTRRLETQVQKARVIAEDLLLRNPKSSAHADRLRRVLLTLGESDPDAVIADRLSLLDDDDAFAASEPAPAPVTATRTALRSTRRQKTSSANTPVCWMHSRTPVSTWAACRPNSDWAVKW